MIFLQQNIPTHTHTHIYSAAFLGVAFAMCTSKDTAEHVEFPNSSGVIFDPGESLSSHGWQATFRVHHSVAIWREKVGVIPPVSGDVPVGPRRVAARPLGRFGAELFTDRCVKNANKC